MALNDLCYTIIDSTIASYTVEQARCHKFGQQDLMAYNMSVLGLSCIIGAVLGAVFVGTGQPKLAFGVTAIVTSLSTLAAAFTERELETNEYAQVKDACLTAYMDEQRTLHPDQEPKRPSCCVQLGFKFKALCEALKNPPILRFYFFLILQGLMMPSFYDFDYYFAIDVLEIPASWLSLQFIWAAMFILIVPSVYVSKFKDTEYRRLFMTVQILWAVSYFGKLSLSMGWS